MNIFKSLLLDDVKKFLDIYQSQLIPYKFQRKTVDNILDVKKDEAMVIQRLESYRKRKNSEWMPMRDLMSSTSKYFKLERLNEIINILIDKGVIEKRDKMIKIKSID